MPAGSAPSQTLSHEAPRLSPTSAATRQRTLADVTLDVARSLEPPGNTYFTWMWVLTVVLGAGIVAWTVQTWKGLGMAGLRAPQFWALYMAAFVYWIGLGHAGTLISAILYLFRARWRTSVYRAAEAMTVFAVMTAGLFPILHQRGRMRWP
jgi:Ni/Fe-hydrogenase subunit HybB-like protein